MISRRARWLSVATSSVVTLTLVSQAFGQAVVLGVVPEGAVIDVATVPELQPGAKVGFRRADGSGAQIGDGSVIDVRDGRALVELQPGATVQAGDLAVACASSAAAGSPADLRVSLQGLKTQLLSAGGGSAELQAAIGQLESLLDARDAAIRAGACDVTAEDQQIAALTQQLQQLVVASAQGATAAPAPSAPSLPSSSADVPPLPLPPSGSPAQETVGTSPGTSPTAFPSNQSEGFTAALQLVKELFQMAQSMGLTGGSKSSGGQQPVSGFPPADVPPAVGAMPPFDPGAGQAGPFVPAPPPPPVTAAPPPSSPPIVSTPPSTPPPTATNPPSSPPPPVVTTPPSPAPPTTARPPQAPPPRLVLDPRLRLPGGRTGDSSPPPEKPKGRSPSLETPATGQWWTIPAPKQSPVVAGTTPGTQSGSSPRLTVPGGINRSDSAPATGTSKPPQAGTFAPMPPPPRGSAAQPGAGPIARATPPSPSLRLAVVQGFVRADNGVPVPGAVIAVGGKQAATNARGQFVVSDVPLGRQVLVVTARGFQPGRLALEVSSGEVEKVTMTLRHAGPFAPQSP